MVYIIVCRCEQQLINTGAGWSSSVARRAHNPKAAGSNPAPATKYPYQGPLAQLVRAVGS
jgi:hypothetical protein